MTTSHLTNWIIRSELDYYTMFIKAWIPYNSWYMKEFYDEASHRTTDAKIVDYIKSNSNKYRDKLKSLLTGSSYGDIYFRTCISKLHEELESHVIPNYHDRITFSTISLSHNGTKQHIISHGHFSYKAQFHDNLPKTQKRWVCEVLKKRTTQTVKRIQLYDWSMEDLENDTDFISIQEHGHKNKLKEVFGQINPKKPTLIILPPKKESGNSAPPKFSICIDKSKQLYFINDVDTVSKVLVQLLYDLRCKLFHGELDPTSTNQGIYEQAYNIQRILIKELI